MAASQRIRKTKIVATVGPACLDVETLTAMVEAGVDVFRVNLSHGDLEQHRRAALLAREAAARASRGPVALLFDTRGPEIRVGDLPEPVDLPTGGEAVLGTGEGAIPVTYAGLAGAVRPGDRLLLDDGAIVLQVLDAREGRVRCRVVAGGRLLPRKKVTLPRPPADLSPLHEDDLADLRLAAELEVEFVAASFVHGPAEVFAVRRAIEECGGRQAIIAKIESAAGVEHIDAILEVADGVMVARGDLGVELPPEDLPVIQKRLIDRCRRAGKPAITATQMLESMVEHPRPTRAEASDVANAIFDGTDAVMLSAESARGRYPVEAVRMMARIALKAEEALPYDRLLAEARGRAAPTVTDAVSLACCTTASVLGAAAIVTATHSGYTARMVSRYRPAQPVIAATPVESVYRQLALAWGVIPVRVPYTQNTDELVQEALEAALETGAIRPGDLVVISAGIPAGVPGTTNTMQVRTVGQVIARGMGVVRKPHTGRARVVHDPAAEAARFADGDVLVARATDAEFVPLMQRAGAIVVEEGGLSNHAAIVGLSLGVPTIIGAAGATDAIADGQLVTVDGERGLVYAGRATVR